MKSINTYIGHYFLKKLSKQKLHGFSHLNVLLYASLPEPYIQQYLLRYNQQIKLAHIMKQ